MERVFCSSSDDEEVVNVPSFFPSEASTPVTSNSDSVVEIVFSNLTKESCLEIKQAMVKWAEMNLKFNPGQREDSKSEKLRLSGKFRIENGSGTKPRVIFLPSALPPLTSDDLKDAWKVNESVERLLEVPLYERTATQLPKIKDVDPTNELRPVQHHKCFNCGSYHHQIRNCRREGARNEHRGMSDGDRSGTFSSNRGRGSRGRGSTRTRHGRSPEADSSRHSRRPSGSRSMDPDRKRSRSRDYSEKDQRSKAKDFSVIKILTDSEEEGSEEGEVIESKKQKIDETIPPESDLEEGEIVPCPTPPPPPRGLEPPPPPPVNSLILPPSVLVHQNPVQAPQRQPISTVVYMAPPNAQGMPSPVVNLRGTPTVQIVSPLPQNNILLATRPTPPPPPPMPTTVLLQNGAFHRPVFAPRATNVAFRGPPPPAHSGMLVYDRNGNHLIARPRLR